MNLATVIVPIYCVLVTMFSGERTTYSPKNMELTGNMPTNSAPNSPMSPRFIDDNTVRRNLLPEFNCETPSPIRGSVESETLCNATEHHRGQNGVTWSAFVRFWILCSVIMCYYNCERLSLFPRIPVTVSYARDNDRYRVYCCVRDSDKYVVETEE